MLKCTSFPQGNFECILILSSIFNYTFFSSLCFFGINGSKMFPRSYFVDMSVQIFAWTADGWIRNESISEWCLEWFTLCSWTPGRISINHFQWEVAISGNMSNSDNKQCNEVEWKQFNCLAMQRLSVIADSEAHMIHCFIWLYATEWKHLLTTVVAPASTW